MIFSKKKWCVFICLDMLICHHYKRTNSSGRVLIFLHSGFGETSLTFRNQFLPALIETHTSDIWNKCGNIPQITHFRKNSTLYFPPKEWGGVIFTCLNFYVSHIFAAVMPPKPRWQGSAAKPTGNFVTLNLLYSGSHICPQTFLNVYQKVAVGNFVTLSPIKFT